MNDKLVFRSFNDEDYITIFKWWNWWWGEEKGIERIVLASSVNALGAGWPATLWGEPPIPPEYFPIDEKHKTRNKDVYSMTKWLGEEMAESFARKRKVQISSMRFHALWDEETAKNYVKAKKKMDLGSSESRS